MSAKIRKAILFCSFLVFSSIVFCQKTSSSCVAVFLDDHLVVDEYSEYGQCIIDYNVTGSFTVQTVILSSEQCQPTGQIKFRLAIRRGASNTLVSFSDNTFEEVPVEDVLSKCHAGDSILVMLVDEGYTLPHNEIIVHYAQ
ncbi:MAG: hypothetical protein KDC80_05545 [Saprospiraceae bacterium]|nr:hypothetical protein [Saprospiraceae bacterium]